MTAPPEIPARARAPIRADRVYLGWQHALLHPDPGPPPRRPTPPEQEQLNPDWVAAQRREENLLNRPLRLTVGCAAVLAAILLAAWALGVLNALLAGLGLIVCLFGAGLAGLAIWQGEQALREHVREERRRLDRIRADQESRLFAWQAEHATRFQEWQARRLSYERQMHWYAVSLPGEVDRVDVVGGTLAGWSAMLTMIGALRLGAGGEVTVLDLSEGAVAKDLLAFARWAGIAPLVWLLPVDLPRLDLGAGLGTDALADVLSLVVSVSEEHDTAREASYDNAILERVIGVLGGQPTVASVAAALRVLAQVGDPRDDMSLGLISAEQVERITAMFGRRATDRVVVERAWALESQLRTLEGVGSARVALPPSRLRVASMDRHAGMFGNKVLGTYMVTALTHTLRQQPAGQPWQHTVFVLGAEKLRGDVLDRLADACETTRTGLVLAHRSIPAHVRERVGRGNAAVAFMRLGNADDAKVASEQIGTEHRFLLTQLTDTVGTSVTDSTGDSYTSTVGTADSVTASAGTTATTGRSRGRGRSQESGILPPRPSTWSRTADASTSLAASDSESITEGISASTAWGASTSRAASGSESLGQTVQRSREFLVEQHELQQLPPTAMIISYASAAGRRVVMADANPGILVLPTASMLDLEEARHSPPAVSWAAGQAVPGNGPVPGGPVPALRQGQRRPATPVSWRAKEGQPPPNLGPPPARPDWRKKPRDS